jgi:hypothetical protein
LMGVSLIWHVETSARWTLAAGILRLLHNRWWLIISCRRQIYRQIFL